jgi:hypothetical protein
MQSSFLVRYGLTEFVRDGKARENCAAGSTQCIVSYEAGVGIWTASPVGASLTGQSD